MGSKMKLFSKSLFLHRKIANVFGQNIVVAPVNSVVTQRMAYDNVSGNLYEKYAKHYDYCRYRAFELAVEEIKERYTEKEIKDFSVAEAGVFLGNFAWIINHYFPNINLYLYDTFESFDAKDVEKELDNQYTSEDYMREMREYFDHDISADEKIRIVKSKMVRPEKCIFRKGFFPATADEEKNKKWVFVSLDMDLYQPILDGIVFFYPNLVMGGVYFCT